MERLTQRYKDKIFVDTPEAAISRLAVYEDTGLEPEEIIELRGRMEGLDK